VRILHVTKKLPPVVGGDSVAVSSLGRVQEARGHEVHFLVYRAQGIPSTDRVHPVGPTQTPESLDRIGAGRLRGMRAMRTWARDRLTSLQPDVVHAHAVDVGASVVETARDRGIPIVLTCHGVWFPHRSRWSPAGWMERSLLHRGYGAITSVDRASLEALRRVGFSDAILVPNGVDPAEFSGTSRSDGDPIRFLFVGRHVYQKGIDLLLEAAGRLRSRLGEPFVVEIAGDGPYRARLESQARSLGLSDAVRFLGSLSRPDLVRAYARSSVLVLPSRFEGFPLAILEAWAAGRPVIASAVDGIPDLCDPGNSVLVPPDDVAALTEAMASLAGDRERREGLGTAGRSLVTKRYAWDIIADAYDRVYDRSREQRV
jgi:glycosyltransferase involved in cell wall biosynthesis